MVVMLNDVSKSILPMLIAEKSKLEDGHELSEIEISLLSDCLSKVKHCMSFSQDDEHCRAIFASTVHLLHDVISQALENAENSSQAAYEPD